MFVFTKRFKEGKATFLSHLKKVVETVGWSEVRQGHIERHIQEDITLRVRDKMLRLAILLAYVAQSQSQSCLDTTQEVECKNCDFTANKKDAEEDANGYVRMPSPSINAVPAHVHTRTHTL